MEKCKCIDPAEGDVEICFCGRCGGVVDDETAQDKILYLEPNTFKEAVIPLMKWLAENKHPHMKVVVEGNIAELLEGVESVVTDEFILD